MELTLNQLCRIMPACSHARAEQMLPYMNAAMARANINTPLRAAAFAAQVGHESMDLVFMKEIASGSAYEGRLDLGNSQEGDGRRFKGRGPIQITGRDNYTKFAAWSHLDCVKHPELLEEPANGFLASAWFWMTRGLNELTDKPDFLAVSVRINGRGANGLPNGWIDRQNRFTNARAVLA